MPIGSATAATTLAYPICAVVAVAATFGAVGMVGRSRGNGFLVWALGMLLFGGSEDSALGLVLLQRPTVELIEATRVHVRESTHSSLDTVASWEKGDDASETFWMERGMETEDRMAVELRVLDRAEAVLRHWSERDLP